VIRLKKSWNILEGIILKDLCRSFTVCSAMFTFRRYRSPFLMNIFKGCKSSLEQIHAQSFLKTPGGLLGNPSEIKSVRGILYDKKCNDLTFFKPKSVEFFFLSLGFGFVFNHIILQIYDYIPFNNKAQST
jgi:hypothetical protein